MKKIKNNEKGITLVTLVIMIIIMLLLSSMVALNFSKNDGLWYTGQEYKNTMDDMIINSQYYEVEEQQGWDNVINRKGIDEELDTDYLNSPN